MIFTVGGNAATGGINLMQLSGFPLNLGEWHRISISKQNTHSIIHQIKYNFANPGSEINIQAT